MKPSEQFAELKATIDKMDDGQDKADLLALFAVADGLHDRADTFDITVRYLRAVARAQQKEMWEELRWFRKWLPLLEHFEKRKHEEKVVSLTKARESE